MLQRSIYKELLSWYNGDRKKALIVRGLKQVGKTYLIEYFVHQKYENVVEINFKENENVKKIFDGDFDINRITLELSAAMSNIRFVPKKTIIFFDEIQDCTRARSSIKFFIKDGRYDVIGSGSLLGLRNYNRKLNQDVPVGFEHIIDMYPLNFMEFLWAKGINQEVIDSLKECYQKEKKIPDTIHNSMLRYFKEYLVVGGMPSVVETFLKTNDMNAILESQRDLVNEYKDDFGKHLDDNENERIDRTLLTRIEEVFTSIPNQLAKENKRFQYSLVKKGGKGREYCSTIEWLVDYGLVKKCNNLDQLELPLEGNKDEESFKLYLTDTGLFVSMLEDGTAFSILSNNILTYKGAIYENIVADAFIKNNEKLYYFHKNSGLEVDFVKRINNELTLIEVKSNSGNIKSTNTILKNKDKYNVNSAIKLGNYNIGRDKEVLTLPYYLVCLL